MLFLIVPLPGHGEMDLAMYLAVFVVVVAILVIPFVAYWTVTDARQL